MIFEFTEKARKYIDKKGKDEYTVERFKGNCSCGKGLNLAVVNHGAPGKEQHLYAKHELNDPKVTLYIDRFLKFNNDRCIVDLEKFLLAENLTVKNIFNEL